MWGSLITTSWGETTGVGYVPAGKPRHRLKTDLPLPRLQVALQAQRFGEASGVPREIPLLVRVVDVEPDDVVGDAVPIEPSVHGLHVGLVLVAVAALMVPQGEQGGQGLVA